ncbi:MAG: hypothetical protein VYE19_06865, partial [Chloroflexota bacterium]|nr:hypothetical protein [Chloroflexota bacterium]
MPGSFFLSTSMPVVSLLLVLGFLRVMEGYSVTPSGVRDELEIRHLVFIDVLLDVITVQMEFARF